MSSGTQGKWESIAIRPLGANLREDWAFVTRKFGSLDAVDQAEIMGLVRTKIERTGRSEFLRVMEVPSWA